MKFSHRLPRTGRTLAVLLALLVALAGPVTGSLATGASAATGQSSGLTPVTGPLAFTSGRYVVVLRDPAATRYSGGAGFPRTSAAAGDRFDSRSRAVRAYTDHLARTQRAVAVEAGARIARHYTVAVNGFAARLTAGQAGRLARDDRVLLVVPDRRLHVDGTPSPAAFLGLSGARGAWARHGGPRSAGAGTVVGVIDSGVWPESRSFAGHRLTDRPRGPWDYRRKGAHTFMRKADGSRFTGVCETGERFRLDDCSTKLIGARYYPRIFDAVSDPSPDEYLSARDGTGHGTHVASTAAGDFAVRARVEGRDFGRISGVAPGASIAVYKACFADGDQRTDDCFTSAALAAIDDAVRDGVDVINYSLSGPMDTVLDPVELAFEGAAEAGIFVATAAGNGGPEAGSVAHGAPWVTTAGASTYTSFVNTVVLGDREKVVGASVADTPVPRSPLVDSAAVAAPGKSLQSAALCDEDSLDPRQVKGTIVVCTRGVIERVLKSAEVARAGGVGMILVNPSEDTQNVDFHSVPTVHVDVAAGRTIERYLARAGDRATAAIRLGDLSGHPVPVPQVAPFSSRGPSAASGSDILKPDLVAPGVDVLGAVAPPTDAGRRFDLYSGTSMAAPQVAGLAAFLAAERPRWSPMQIKSAMMTSAGDLVDADGRPDRDPFSQGAGILSPARAFDPGLFVTAGRDQWRGYLAGQGLANGAPPVAAGDLNEPSFAAGQVASSVSFRRRFVAARKGVWAVSVDVPGFSASTSARRVVASRPGEAVALTVHLRRTTAPVGQFASGSLTLTGPTRVRIPVTVRPVTVQTPGEVAGSGTDGTATVRLRAGVTGAVDVAVSGLAKADTADGTLQAGEADRYCVTTSGSSRALRADLDAVQDRADLNLAAYLLDGGCGSDRFTEVALSARQLADETVTVLDPEPGAYLLEVYRRDDGLDPTRRTGYRLDVYDVDDSTAVGGLHAEPAPLQVLTGRPATFRVLWSGLEPGTRYLGLLRYDGAPAPTFLTVDTGGS